MGQLILCHPYRASQPYTVAVTGAKVYAIEELCYYLCENLYLVDDSILDLELCQWLEAELRMPVLADVLRGCLRRNASCADFVETLLRESGYCDEKELYEIHKILARMMEMSGRERLKIRADRLVMNKKYALALMEYIKLLQKGEPAPANKEERKLNGNIWHNIGLIYANLFLFAQAEACFETAYSFNYSSKSFEAQTRAAQYRTGGTGITESDKEGAYRRLQDELAAGGPGLEREQLGKMLDHLSADCRKMYSR